MSFRLSPCVGICSPNATDAIELYRDALGARPIPGEGLVHLACGPLHIFVDPGQPRPPVFEFLVTNLADARKTAKASGFEEIVWQGQGGNNFLVDPFGVTWNVTHDLGFDPEEFGEGDSPVLPKLGILTHEPHNAAMYYSAMLGEPASKIGDAFIIDSGPIRLRIQAGLPVGSCLWLNSDFDPTLLGGQSGKSSLTDANRVHWRIALPNPGTQAAVMIQEEPKSKK
ncbi:MAG: VOC family protein [Armatimonadetes bacterium]|nr:VOC family protein [Armatimonadota bacterium]